MSTNIAIEQIGKVCTGCEACVSGCPQKALTMKMDGEGFFYPVVDDKQCTRCGLCEKLCPVATPQRVSRNPLPENVWAGSHLEKETRLASASGGAFSAIVEQVKPDAVYGTAWIAPDSAAVIRTAPEDMAPLRNSKYVQSRVDDAYQKVKQDLAQGKTVLFSGTPCQIGGLLAFLGKRTENLVTVEIICHGAASPGVFQDYLLQIARRAGKKVKSYVFREKHTSRGEWEAFHTAIRYDDGTVQRTYFDPFTHLFLSKRILRPSCATCPYSGMDAHAADIIIGDYWGCNEYNPELYEKTGVSVVLALTWQGREIVTGLSDVMHGKEVPLASVTANNKTLLAPRPAPQNQRDEFFEFMRVKGSEAAFAKFAIRPTWKQRLKPYLRSVVRRFRG